MKILRLEDYIIKLINSGYTPLDIGIEAKGVSSCPICDCKSFYNFHQPQDQNYSNNISVCLRCGPYTYKRKTDFRESGADLIGYFPMLTTNIPDYNLSSYLRHRFESNKISNINNITNIESKDILNSLIENANANIPNFSERQYYLLRSLEFLQEDLGEKIFINIMNLEFAKKVAADSLRILNNIMPVYRKNYSNLGLDRFQEIKDYLVSFSYLKKDEELEYCLKSLHDTKYINYKEENGTIEILPNGYEYLENHKIKDQKKSDKVFVAMSFKEENNNLWEIIKTTLEDKLGYKAVRSDKKDFEGWIMDFILSSINESRFVIGDLSDENNGVYFELGYAQSKEIPIILITNDMNKVHFDLRQYNTIAYKDFEELKERLYWRIKNLFGSNK